MLEELEQAAEALGVKVLYERLSPEASPGGLCRVGGEYRIMVDRQVPLLERVNVLLGAVARFPTEGIFLSPELREEVEKRAASLAASEGALDRKAQE
ncbi:MAG: hypothetical protein RBU30_00780 [Polyangia bacterium]|nr:hypothetical protein [Polyangia bacterium]